MALKIKMTVGKIELSMFPILTTKQKALVKSMAEQDLRWSELTRAERSMAGKLLKLNPAPIVRNRVWVEVTAAGRAALDA